MEESMMEYGMLYNEDGMEIEDSKQFCKDFVKAHKKYAKKMDKESEKDDAKELKKMSKHHPCQLMPEENRLDCAKDYEKMYGKCMDKDSSSKKMKKCLRKECVKKLEKEQLEGIGNVQELCHAMEKQSKKYQKKMNKKE